MPRETEDAGQVAGAEACSHGSQSTSDWGVWACGVSPLAPVSTMQGSRDRVGIVPAVSVFVISIRQSARQLLVWNAQ